MRSATCLGVAPSSRSSSIGRKLCDHRLSAAPSQPYQREPRRFETVGVLRSTTTLPIARRSLSVQLRSGTWHEAHDVSPTRERRASKKRRVPNSIASGLPDTRLLLSGVAGIGHGPCERIVWISLSENVGAPAGRSSARLVHANITQVTPRANRAKRIGMTDTF